MSKINKHGEDEMKPSIRIQEEICLSVGLTEEAKTRYLVNIVCKILDEHAEAIEQLKMNVQTAISVGYSNLSTKPKSLTLKEIEAVIDRFDCGQFLREYLKQAFRDRLK